MRHVRSFGFGFGSALSGLAVLVTLALAGPPAGRAEDEAAPEDAEVELITSQPLCVEDLLQVVGRVADLPFLWDPGTRELGRGKLVAAMNLRTTRRELLGLVRSILASYDLALVPLGPEGNPIYRVMAVRDLGSAATLRPRPIDLDASNAAEYRAAAGLFVTTTLRTRYVQDLASVRTALRVHATREDFGRVEILPELPGFAVTDFAPAVVAMYDALAQIDVPPVEPRFPARVTQRIDLEHADAVETARGLADHLGANRPLPTGEALTVAAREEPALGLRILADERTNALLVSGSPDRVAEVQEAVALLDVPAARPALWIHVLPLEHLDAIETAQALRELMSGRAGPHARDDAPPPTIVAEVQTNALLVEATPKAYEALLAVVRQLDVESPEEAAGADR